MLQNSFLVGYDTSSTGNRILTFRHDAISPSSNVKISYKNVCRTFMFLARLYCIWKVFESKFDGDQIDIFILQPLNIPIKCSSLTLRLLMSCIYIYIYIYIYMEHLFLMFLDHTQRRSTVGRTPLDE